MKLNFLSAGIFAIVFSSTAYALDPYIELSKPSDIMEIHVNSSQYAPNGQVTKTEINFGDGSAVATKSDVYHKYTAAGNYTLTVKVWNALNVSSTYDLLPLTRARK